MTYLEVTISFEIYDIFTPKRKTSVSELTARHTTRSSLETPQQEITPAGTGMGESQGKLMQLTGNSPVRKICLIILKA